MGSKYLDNTTWSLKTSASVTFHYTSNASAHILSLLVYGTEFRFCAYILCDVETPVYFHPSTIANDIPPVPWGYFSLDPNPATDGKDSLMEPDPNAPEFRYDAYRSTLAGVDAVF